MNTNTSERLVLAGERKSGQSVRSENVTAVSAIATSPWAPLVAIGGQKQILLYNTKSLQLVGVLDFPEGIAHVLKFSRSGGLLLAAGGKGSYKGQVVVWDIKTGERVIEVGNEKFQLTIHF